PVEQVPDGVVFVIGTRSVEDLPNHIRPAAQGDRLIEVGRLTRQAVGAICEGSGVGEASDQIHQDSDGHPLLVWTLIGLIAEQPMGEWEEILSALPPLEGEIGRFYEAIWLDLKDQPDLVHLLGLVCRLRRHINLNWLKDTGSDPVAILRLETVAYLFERPAPSRWYFFHSSFREF